jgi:hypothetical protein
MFYVQSAVIQKRKEDNYPKILTYNFEQKTRHITIYFFLFLPKLVFRHVHSSTSPPEVFDCVSMNPMPCVFDDK